MKFGFAKQLANIPRKTWNADRMELYGTKGNDIILTAYNKLSTNYEL